MRGPAYSFAVSHACSTSKANAGLTLEQIVVSWALVFAQSVRRLYESYAYSKSSSSSMWIGHWIMGLGFYFLINIALWVEGIPAIEEFHTIGPKMSMTRLAWAATVLQIWFVAYHMYRQNRLHYYLSTLPAAPNYELPTKDEFKTIVSPHYGHEISIYHGLAVIGSLNQSIIQLNWTLILGYLFVYVNLRTTAKGTKAWYATKFGDKAVRNKSLMLTKTYPFI